MRTKLIPFSSLFLIVFFAHIAGQKLHAQDPSKVALSNNNCQANQSILFGENLHVFNLGDQINSTFDEYNPVLDNTRTFMLYTARRDSTTGQDIYAEDGDYYEDIMISKRDGRRFNSSSLLDQNDPVFSINVNTARHEAPVWISQDEELLIIYKQDMLWYSTKTESGYTVPVKYDKNVNFSDYQRHASITADGNKIYFSAEGKFPKTGRVNFNIYECTREEDGSWSKPILTPGLINSVYNEDSPEVSPDGNTMYFSSDHPDGFGGYDIYMSTLENGEWTQPINLCEPINSAGSDIFFKLSNDGAYAYFSSDRLGGYGGQDIYKLVIDNPSFADCKEYSKELESSGLIIASRDTVQVNTPIAFDGSSSHFNQQTPSAWYWKNGREVYKNERVIESTFKTPGMHDITMQLSYVSEEFLDVEYMCATKKLVVLSKSDYQEYLGEKGGVAGMQALVGQDEVLLQMENTIVDNPFELKPEAENTYVNTPFEIYTLVNDEHPEGSPLKLIDVESPLNGLVQILDSFQGIVKYRPNKNYVGVDKFYYTAVDDQGMQARSFTAIQVLNESAFMSNQSVKNDEAKTEQDSAVIINVLANDQDLFGGVLSVSKVGRTQNGVVEIVDAQSGDVKYTPNRGFSGKDVFTYTAMNEAGQTNSATVTVEVGEKKSELIGVKNLKYTKMDVPVTFGVLDNDIQTAGLAMSVAGVTPPTNGYIKILNPNSGRLLYTPKRGFVGTDAFTYTLKDIVGNQATVPVNVIVAPEQGNVDLVAAVEQPSPVEVAKPEIPAEPIAVAEPITPVEPIETVKPIEPIAVAEPTVSALSARIDRVSTQSETPVTISLFDNDVAGNKGISLSSVQTPSNGSVTVKDSIKGIIEYVSNSSFTGAEQFEYVISDNDEASAKASVLVNVLSAEKALLVLRDDRTETQQNESVELSLFDNDQHEIRISLVGITQPENGQVVVVNADLGLVQYIPYNGYSGVDHFTYKARDREGNEASANVLVTVIEPILSASFTTEGLPDLDLNPIYFDFDQSTIREDAQKILDENIRILKQNPDLIIKVSSHCDSRGSMRYNMYLSERRAKSTVDYMVAHGISNQRIIAVLGMGESNLVNDCDGSVWCPPSDHQLNRRSDFIIVAKKK